MARILQLAILVQTWEIFSIFRRLELFFAIHEQQLCTPEPRTDEIYRKIEMFTLERPRNELLSFTVYGTPIRLDEQRRNPSCAPLFVMFPSCPVFTWAPRVGRALRLMEKMGAGILLLWHLFLASMSFKTAVEQYPVHFKLHHVLPGKLVTSFCLRTGN